MEVFVVTLRPYGGDIIVEGVMTLEELAASGMGFEMRMRYNPEIHLTTLRVPDRTSKEQVETAINLMSKEERQRMYNLPRHPIVDRRHTG